MRAVDTNVLVRALVQDDPTQARRAQACLNAQRVYVPVTVILELEWVLRSRYDTPGTRRARQHPQDLPRIVRALKEGEAAAQRRPGAQLTTSRGAPLVAAIRPTTTASPKPCRPKTASTASSSAGAQDTSKPPLVCGSDSKA